MSFFYQPSPITTRGDLIRGGALGVPERFAAVTANTFVGGDGTDVASRTSAQARISFATQSWAVAGSVVDYTADSNYSPSGLTSDEDGSVSGILGDGTTTPYFYAILEGNISALARNSNGLRITCPTSNTATAGQQLWPHSSAGGVAVIPIAVSCGSQNYQIDLKLACNIESVGRGAGGSDWIEASAALVRWTANALPDRLAEITIYSYISAATTEVAYAFANTGATGTIGTSLDVSGAGEGTSGGITVRDIRFIVKGPTLDILSGPSGGSLTRRLFRGRPRWLSTQGDVSIVFGVAQSRATPQAGYYAELRSLTVTPL